MIKIFSLLLLSVIYLQSAGFWTLSGITKANIYISNNVSSLKPSTLKNIKQKMLEMLKKESIETDKQDSPILIVNLAEIENDDSHYVYIRLSIGEDVQTSRKDKSHTFALTYNSNDFIETDNEELDTDILESIDFLLSQFMEQYEDDKE